MLSYMHLLQIHSGFFFFFFYVHWGNLIRFQCAPLYLKCMTLGKSIKSILT